MIKLYRLENDKIYMPKDGLLQTVSTCKIEKILFLGAF